MLVDLSELAGYATRGRAPLTSLRLDSRIVAIRRGPRVDAVVYITERRFTRRGLASEGRREPVAVQRVCSDHPCGSG